MNDEAIDDTLPDGRRLYPQETVEQVSAEGTSSSVLRLEDGFEEDSCLSID